MRLYADMSIQRYCLVLPENTNFYGFDTMGSRFFLLLPNDYERAPILQTARQERH